MSVENIAVIGSGQMGSGIAQVASLSGYNVILIDIKDEFLLNAIKSIEYSLGKFVSKEKITREDADKAIKNIITTTDINKCSTVDLVIEAVPEIPELKFNLFKQLDGICNQSTILASNTSSISINELATHTSRPELVIGMHFMNPVPIMKLVEVINTLHTSDQTTKKIIEISELMKKTPIQCNDYPGFVANRILMPMINEAIITLFEGVAGVEEIDTVMKLGMAHPMGPLQLADFIGLPQPTVAKVSKILLAKCISSLSFNEKFIILEYSSHFFF